MSRIFYAQNVTQAIEYEYELHQASGLYYAFIFFCNHVTLSTIVTT